MDLELEVKFFPIDKDHVTAKLKKIGAKLEHDERLMRRMIFDHRQNPGINCTYARVRDEGDKITASLKVNAEAGGSIYDQKEVQIIVDSFKNATSFVKGLGLIQTNYQENKRETWQYLNSEIVIDTWPALDTYIEIEGPTEEEIKKIAAELGMNWDERIFVSTDELYAKKYNLTKEKALKAISTITFEDIPEIFNNIT